MHVRALNSPLQIFQKAVLLHDHGRLREAERLYQSVLMLDERHFGALCRMGQLRLQQGQFDDAERCFRRALKLEKRSAEAHQFLAFALTGLGRLQEAVRSYEKAIAIRPSFAEAHNNLGYALQALGRLDEAMTRYEKAIAIRPDYYEAHTNFGNVLQSLKRSEDAIARYKTALKVRPDYADAHRNLAIALRAIGRLGDAIAVYDCALALRPNDAYLLSMRGDLLAHLDRDEEALAAFEAALEVDPDYDFAFNALARGAKGACDWTRAATVSPEVPAHVAKGRFFHPFNFLHYSGDAALQLACAKQFADHAVPVRPPQLWQGGTWRNRKIKIAYVATGFLQHPTAYLTAELIEIHDRSRFEILGVSLGPNDQSEIRARLIRAFDQFYDVREKNDYDIAVLLNDLQVDIAVDRSGHITDARPGIFAARPAPIQVNYLGYPGTLGASFYDYILADATVLPFDQQPFYSEKIVHLPDCYQVNDSKRPVAARSPSRKQEGLPPEGFIFCCFNNSYKITPVVFDIWMRLLRRVEGSVLWLFSDRPAAEANLGREATARGIDPSRLVFARRVPQADHLARQRLADLFLDTLPYNAHTTASDALWVGIPVVTCCGESFAGRVATSVLRAIGMPDLVTDDLEAYERLALRIATEPSVLQQMGERLRRNRLSHPLFDTHRYRRHIETAYARMWERWQNGKEPVSFTVECEQGDVARDDAR